MTITRQTGFPADANLSVASPSASCTTAAVGDILLLYGRISSTTTTITSVTGGNVASWTKIFSTVVNGVTLYCYWGVVNATGSSTTTVNLSTATTCEMVFDEFTTGGAPTWSVESSNTTSGSSTTMACPSLTPAASGDAYLGYMRAANTASVGSTSGFTYTSLSSTSNIACFDGSVASGTAYSPTAPMTPTGAWASFGVILSATSGASSAAFFMGG